MTVITGRSGSRYLVSADELNRGGRAVLYRCAEISGTATRVYKSFKKPLADPEAIRQLTRVYRRGRPAVLRAEAAGGVARTPLDSINWPVDLVGVTGSDQVAGVVLPLIPDQFLLPGGKPRTLDFLTLPRAAPPEARVRVGVLIRICEIFGYLESVELLHGDFSAKNLVWCPDPPHAYLIDCDGLHSWDPPPTGGVATDQWTDPRFATGRIMGQDQYSDRFALALALYRGLFLNPAGRPYLKPGTDKWQKAEAFPAALDAGLRALFSQALDKPFREAARPSPAMWRTALFRAFIKGSNFHVDALKMIDVFAERNRLGSTGTTSGTMGARAYTPAGATTLPNLRRMNRAYPAPHIVATQPAPKPAHVVPSIGQTSPARRSRAAPITAGVAVFVLIVILVLAGVSSSHGAPVPGFPSGQPGPTAQPTSGSDPAAMGQAQAVSDLLQQSSQDRSLANQGVEDIEACDPTDGASDLSQAYQDRENEVDSVDALDTDQLPNGPALQQVLVTLLQDSASADQAYEQWAEDLESSGCSSPLPDDSNRSDGDDYSNDANSDKDQFVALWTPIADQYQLPTVSDTDL